MGKHQTADLFESHFFAHLAESATLASTNLPAEAVQSPLLESAQCLLSDGESSGPASAALGSDGPSSPRMEVSDADPDTPAPLQQSSPPGGLASPRAAAALSDGVEVDSMRGPGPGPVRSYRRSQGSRSWRRAGAGAGRAGARGLAAMRSRTRRGARSERPRAGTDSRPSHASVQHEVELSEASDSEGQDGASLDLSDLADTDEGSQCSLGEGGGPVSRALGILGSHRGQGEPVSETLPGVGGYGTRQVSWPSPRWRKAERLGVTLQQGHGSQTTLGRRGAEPIAAGVVLPVPRYGTIRCFPCSHYTSTVLTRRNWTDLPTQLHYDTGRSWPPNVRCVSPEFAEWLMGLPGGWTQVAGVSAAALARHPVSALRASQGGQPLVRTCSLFSGCGALDFGLSPWLQPAVYCESDEAAVRVLEQRMVDGSLPRCPIHPDVRELRRCHIPTEAEGIVAGFPCQGMSSARGEARLGLRDCRSGLALEVFRVADEMAASFVLLENVNGLRGRKEDWCPLIQELARRAFTMRWVTLNADSVGCPQRRRRFFLLAVRGRFSHEPVVKPATELGFTLEAPMFGCIRTQTGIHFNNPGRDAVSPWLVPIEEYRRNAALRARLHMLGNAVVPLQAGLALCVLCALPAPP